MGLCVSCRRRERKAPEKGSGPGAGGPAKGAAAAELLPRRSDRLPTMANSMSNIKMTNPIKGFVSKRRKRYQKDGFNLDLAYITDRLIAMGFPAEKLEGVYRNHIDEVFRFLEKMHQGHYMIYNLCSERSYDKSKFHNRVEDYAFEDHSPPKLDIIQPFCESVHNWLSADPKNVAAVHCKAGKGRTGTMICCYLLYCGLQATADEALDFYGTKRAHDAKGVTIPSQRRYVTYYGELLRAGLRYSPSRVHIRELVMTPPPYLYSSQCAPELTITQAEPPFKKISAHELPCASGGTGGGAGGAGGQGAVRVRLSHCTPLCGDVRVDVYNKHKMKRKEKLFHFWFNTFFVTAPTDLGAVRIAPLPDSPNLETYKLILYKDQLDDAHKDKQNKHYSADFKVELIIQKMPDSATFVGQSLRPPSLPSSSASSCSEPDTEPDGHWDSGERIPYIRLSELANDPADCGTDIAGPRDYSEQDLTKYDPTDCATNSLDRSTLPDFQSDPAYTRDVTDLTPSPDDPIDHKNPPFYTLSGENDPFYVSPSDESSAYLLSERRPESDVYSPGNKETSETYYRLTANSTETESTENYYKLSTNGKKSEGMSRTRLSLGDVRASWREFSGKFASDGRKKKDDS